MPCTVCNQNGHNRSTCPIAMSQGVKKKQYKSREEVREFRECPRGYRPVRMGDGTIVLMKHEELYPEKVLCECGVRVSAVDRRALLRHQSTKGHLEWASREYAAAALRMQIVPHPCLPPLNRLAPCAATVPSSHRLSPSLLLPSLLSIVRAG